jgi:hypothetical protein
MLKIMLCSNLHKRMTAGIPLGDGWIVHFGWCFFSVLGLEKYAMMEVKMLTERFIMVPVYVAYWATGTESNPLVVICWSHSGWGFWTGTK